MQFAIVTRPSDYALGSTDCHSPINALQRSRGGWNVDHPAVGTRFSIVVGRNVHTPSRLLPANSAIAGYARGSSATFGSHYLVLAKVKGK